MSRPMRKQERVLGPYEQRGDRAGWRVIRVSEDGSRKRRVFPTEAAANRYKDTLEASLAIADQTTESAWRHYKRHLIESDYKAPSIVTEEWAYDQFFPEPVLLSMLSAKRAEKIYADVRTRPCKTGKPLSNDAHRSALARVKSFLAWCVSQGWIKTNPLANVHGVGQRRPRGKSLGKSGNELRIKSARIWYAKALEMASAGDEGATAALTAMVLGMRAGEIVARRVSDLDEDEAPGDVLWIPCSKTPAGRRTLDVPDVLRPLLVECCAGKSPDAPIFALRDGTHHANDWVRAQVWRVCDKAGVPRVTAHAMRGLLATLTAERGMAGHLIAATLGHTSFEQMTEKAYAAPGSKQAGVNRRGLQIMSGGAK